jgi:hypothetical protein
MKSRFAFEYNTSLAHSDFDWFSRFEIFVPGSILPPELVNQYHACGTRLYFYEWAVAFHDAEARRSAWVASARDSHPDWLLNHGAGVVRKEGASPAWYYDLGNQALREARIDFLVGKLKESNYDGIFFDCLGTFDHGSRPHLAGVEAEFARRHPGQSYAEFLGRFLADLKSRIGESGLFTNQGFRNPKRYLPSADHDLSESYITTHAAARSWQHCGVTRPLTNIHPWNDPDHPWQSSRHNIQHCIVAERERARAQAEVLHLNYAFPVPEKDGMLVGDREAIHYAVAVGKLFGHAAYVQHQGKAEHPEFDHDPIYFVELGPDHGPMIQLGDQLACRAFARGFVVVNGTGQEQEIALPHAGRWRDEFTGRGFTGSGVCVPVNVQLDGHIAPAGRIFSRLE